MGYKDRSSSVSPFIGAGRITLRQTGGGVKVVSD